jgi:hypothetical protein
MDENEDRVNQNKSKGRPKASINLLIPRFDPKTGATSRPFHAVVTDKDGRVIDDTPVTFEVNGNLVTGEYRTNEDGFATYLYPVLGEPANPKVKATAIAVAGTPSVTKTVDFEEEAYTWRSGEVDLLHEHTSLSPTKNSYYLALIDRRGFPVTGKVDVRTSGEISFTDLGLKKDPVIHTDPFTIDFPEPQGRFITYENLTSKPLEIEMIPQAFPKNKKEVKLPAAPERPIRADDNDRNDESSALEILFKGCQ